MNRREFIKTASGAGLCCMASRLFADSDTNRRRPNILWIMMDDGRADTLGCYGRSWVRTPHMDALAARRPLRDCHRAEPRLRSLPQVDEVRPLPACVRRDGDGQARRGRARIHEEGP